MVRIEKNGPVTTVILDRAEARNAVDAETARELYAAFVAFEADADARVAVFCGAGNAFCAGYDLKSAASLADPAAFQREMVEALAFPPGDAPSQGPMGPSRLMLTKPVIAAVEGAAVAGGMELAMWCDVRIMAEDAYFGVYCRRWGVPLIDGGTVRLPRLVGLGRAMELILTGRKVEADEALRIGLCEKVVPRGQARAAAEDMARQIARFPQGAMLADRQSAYEGFGYPTCAALAGEWQRGLTAFRDEGAAGAARFAAGKGRGGGFENI